MSKSQPISYGITSRFSLRRSSWLDTNHIPSIAEPPISAPLGSRGRVSSFQAQSRDGGRGDSFPSIDNSSSTHGQTPLFLTHFSLSFLQSKVEADAKKQHSKKGRNEGENSSTTRQFFHATNEFTFRKTSSEFGSIGEGRSWGGRARFRGLWDEF